MIGYTHVRVIDNDHNRIKSYLLKINDKMHLGHYAQHDIITLAMDFLEQQPIDAIIENILKKNGISTAPTEETPNIA